MKRNEDFGTNTDGDKNKEYCKFCFREGKFTDGGITMEQKIERNIRIAKELGIPAEKAEQMARTIIPTLKRWKMNETEAKQTKFSGNQSSYS